MHQSTENCRHVFINYIEQKIEKKAINQMFEQVLVPFFWHNSSGFPVTPSEYVKHAVFQIWTQISFVSASVGMLFFMWKIFLL